VTLAQSIRNCVEVAMFDRRMVLFGGLLVLVVRDTWAQAPTARRGCDVDDVQLKALLGNNPTSFSFNINTDEIRNGSGNKDFDRALAHTLAKLSDWFTVLPGFAFYDDGNSPNALASPSRRLGRADGSVVFGKAMLSELMARKEHPETCVAAVCAHEFGHITQYKHGLRTRLVGSNGRVKRLELHADFLAGYFAGRRKLERADFPAAVFATTQHSYGSKDFGDADHHGTPDERGNAVVAGFDSAYRARLPLGQAIERGIDYVMRIPG
jgi:hypothetical protein